jgi:hypothetical protein
MDIILGGIAFAALIFGQCAAVIVVHGENFHSADGSRSDYRAKLIWQSQC